MPLPEKRRQQLDGIVKQMVENKESDTNIQFVVDDFVKKYSAEAELPQQQEQKQNIPFGQKVQSIEKNLAIGAGKGVVSTLKGISSLGEKAIRAILPQKAEDFLGFQKGTTVAEQTVPKNWTTPSNTAQAIGKGIEQVGEFFIPVGGEARALKLLEGIIPKAGKLAQLGAKVIGSGAEFAGKTALQTGGDTKQTAISGVLGGVAPIVGAGAGAIKKAITEKMPERIYSIIFKTAKEDLMKAYRTISKGEELNPILAKEALERGIKGSSQNMAVYSLQKLDQLENQVQNVVKQVNGIVKPTIQIENKSGYSNILKTIWNNFKGDFQTERAETAKKLFKELQSSNGNEISTDLGLRLRRFIDNMRNTSSFRMNMNLAPKQEGFKEATNSLRKKLAGAGLKDLMNEERVYINALDDIVADAAKRSNKNVLGLFDLIAGGGGMVAGNITGGISAMLAVRAFQQPITLTNLAQALYKMRNIPSLQGLFKTIPPIINQVSQ